MGDIQIGCSVVGDEGVGKSTLIQSYIKGQFVTNLIDERYFANIEWEGGRSFKLRIIDMPEEAEYRTELYVGIDVAIICYDCTSRATLESARNHWGVEVKEYCTEIPIVLVGTKGDIKRYSRHYDHEEFVELEDAEEVANEIGAEKLIKCSAREMNFVDFVFTSALRSAYKNRKRKRTRRAFDWIPLPNAVRSVIRKPLNIASSAFAIVKQACINVRENWTNPHSLTPTKSEILSMAPCLAQYIPLAEDATLEDTSTISSEDPTLNSTTTSPMYSEDSTLEGTTKSPMSTEDSTWRDTLSSPTSSFSPFSPMSPFSPFSPTSSTVSSDDQTQPSTVTRDDDDNVQRSEKD